MKNYQQKVKNSEHFIHGEFPIISSIHSLDYFFFNFHPIMSVFLYGWRREGATPISTPYLTLSYTIQLLLYIQTSDKYYSHAEWYIQVQLRKMKTRTTIVHRSETENWQLWRSMIIYEKDLWLINEYHKERFGDF